VKVLANFLLITGVAFLAETVATATQHGVPDELLKGLLTDGPLLSAASSLRLDGALDATPPGWFSPTLARKDLRLALDLAEEAGVGARIGPAAEALLTTVIDADGQWPDFTAVIEALT
jgi:3-hydroxyisobutyrate dehydrogenase-like beta-hydroxyacid dehydrogenase